MRALKAALVLTLLSPILIELISARTPQLTGCRLGPSGSTSSAARVPFQPA
jgi:hypothetical protein